MKKTLATLTMLLWMSVWAQADNAQDFHDGFSYFFRVAEAPCPEGLQSASPGAVCYRDFFNFKEMITSLYASGPDSYLEPWRVVTLRLAGNRIEGVRARLRAQENSRPFTLTYVNETLLVLEVGEGRASP